MTKIAYCGLDCGACDYREKCNCPTCHVAAGEMFWGQCPIAKCNMSKGFDNCSQCAEFPCDQLTQFAFDKEQGDNGKRIETLRRMSTT